MKRHVWIAVAGLALLWIAAEVRSTDSTESPRPERISPPREKRAEPAPPPESLPSRPERLPEPAPEESSVATSSHSLPERTASPLELREWILSLTDREFEPLIGTATLDTYVTRVVVALSMDRPEPELHAFMAHLNARIQSLRRD